MFSNPIVGGGGSLIRDQIQSSNFVAGVSGWIIRRDGTAEFNSATFRGDIVVGTSGHPQVHIYTTSNQGVVDLSTGDADETAPGRLYAATIGTGNPHYLNSVLQSPDNGTGFKSGILMASRSHDATLARRVYIGEQILATSTWNVWGYFSSGDIHFNEPLFAPNLGFTEQAFGTVIITPVASTPTSSTVTGLSVAGNTFRGFVTVNTTVPGTTTGVQSSSVSSVANTGLIVWVFRGNNTNTTLYWQVVGGP